jgi:DUF917 family protein
LRLIGEAELEDIAVGAAILGTGGGGNPYVGKLLALQAIAECGPVRLVDVEEVPDDALVVPSCMMGAPTVMVEKLPRGDEALRAFTALQDHLGQRITHTVSIEAGGLNSTIPFVVAARLGLPVVDADGMGRAFPEAQMVTPTMHGVSATPLAIADEKGNWAVLQTVDNHWTERLARSVTIDMGCTAMLACYAMRGSQARGAMVRGTISLAEELGRLARQARARHVSPVDAVAGRLRAVRLFGGKVVDVRRRTEAGFAKGEARLDGLGDDAGGTLALQFQNEHLVALRAGGDAGDRVLASVPDLIIVLDAETGEPITTEELRYGQRVAVLGAPCDRQWRTPAGLELAGPRYFGYDIEYVPVERAATAAATR